MTPPPNVNMAMSEVWGHITHRGVKTFLPMSCKNLCTVPGPVVYPRLVDKNVAGARSPEPGAGPGALVGFPL